MEQYDDPITSLAHQFGLPFVSKLWHDIRAVFLPRILAIFSSLWVFSPSTCPFSSHSPVYSAPRKHWCAQQTRIYLRTNRSQICALQTNMCMWVHSRSLNKKDWIILSAINLLHDRNGRVNFLHGLVFIHCVHSSSGCWHSLESVDCLMIDTERYFPNADWNMAHKLLYDSRLQSIQFVYCSIPWMEVRLEILREFWF